MQRTIRTYWLLTFLSQFAMAFVMPIYVLFLIGKGMNLMQINLVNMIFYVSMLITEIPTGAFADVFGRKRACVMSCLCITLGLLTYNQATSVWGFAGAEIFVGLGATFSTGAYQAWLVDSLRHNNQSVDLTKIFARSQYMTRAGTAIGAVLGGLLAQHALALPWMIAAALTFFNLILITVLMREEYFVPRQTSVFSNVCSTWHAAIRGVRMMRSHSAIRFVLVVSVVQMFALQAPNMQWQPHFATFFPNKGQVGVLFAAAMLAIAVGGMFAPRLTQRICDDRKTILVIQAGIACGIIGAAIIPNAWLAVAFFLFHEVGRGMHLPIKDTYLNHHIDSSDRATLLSCANVSNHLGGIVGLLVSGALAENFSIKVAWIVAGCALLVLSKVHD